MLLYKVHITRVIVKLIEELLVDNKVIVSARHKEKRLSDKTDSLLEYFIFMILRYVYMQEKILNKYLKSSEGIWMLLKLLIKKIRKNNKK